MSSTIPFCHFILVACPLRSALLSICLGRLAALIYCQACLVPVLGCHAYLLGLLRGRSFLDQIRRCLDCLLFREGLVRQCVLLFWACTRVGVDLTPYGIRLLIRLTCGGTHVRLWLGPLAVFIYRLPSLCILYACLSLFSDPPLDLLLCLGSLLLPLKTYPCFSYDRHS